MSSSDNNDSELDSDAFEQELKFYTELYFGYGESNVVNEEYEKCNNENICNGTLSSSLLTSNGNDSIGINSKLSNDSIKNDLENQDKKFKSKDVNKEKKTPNKLKLKEVKEKNTPKKLKSKDVKVKMSSIRKQKRTRNPSICSIESISGHEPLDNLYCIDLTLDDEPLDTIDEILDDSKYDSSMLQADKEICDRNETEINSSTSEELSILPSPSPKKIETVFIDNENSNSSSIIKIVDCVKRKKSQSNLRKKKKKNSKTNIVILSSDNQSSDSDDNDNLDVSSVPLVFKFGSDIISTNDNNIKKKSKHSSVYLNSPVIYSKVRASTKKLPSCPTWTQEMANLYDSDYSDEFSVEEIHKFQNSHPRNWKICSEDLQIGKKSRKRYFEVRCTRCREFGHLVDSCKRLPHCLYCSDTDHKFVNKCPKNCCLRCGKSPHNFCQLTDNRRICKECNQFGHNSTLCPDLWRRYHATTIGSIPVIPDKSRGSANKRVPSCYNCSKRGHYGHECKVYDNNNYRDGKFQFRKTYRNVSTEIFSYESTYVQEKPSIVELSSDEENAEINNSRNLKESVASSAKKKKKQKKKKTIIIEDDPLIQEEISLTKAQYNMFQSNEQSIIKQLEILSTPHVKSISLDKCQFTIKISGTKLAVMSASGYVSMVLTKSPRVEYDKFMKCVRIHNAPSNVTPRNKNDSACRHKSETETPKRKVDKEYFNVSGTINSSVGDKITKHNVCESSVDVNSKCAGLKMPITEESANKNCTLPNGDKSQQQKCNKLSSKSEKSSIIENKELLSSSTIQWDDEASSSQKEITELPLPFPHNRTEAIQTLEQMTMKMDKSVLRNYIDCTLDFFEKCAPKNILRNANYLKYIQALARIVYVQAEIKGGSKIIQKLQFLKQKLEKTKKRKLHYILIDKISNIYWHIANPPHSKVKKLLNLTKEFKEKLEALECNIQKQNVHLANKSISELIPNKLNEIDPTIDVSTKLRNSRNTRIAIPNKCSTPSHTSSACPKEKSILSSTSALPTPKHNVCESSLDVKDANSECAGLRMPITREEDGKYCATPNGNKSQQQKCNKLPSKSEKRSLIENKELLPSSTIQCNEEASFSQKDITELAFPFPLNKTEAIQALEQVTMKMDKPELKHYIDCALDFFEKHPPKNVSRNANYLKNIQALAKIVYIQAEMKRGSKIAQKLQFLKQKLEKTKKHKLNYFLHHNISNIYWEIANPPYSKLNMLLKLTKEFKEKLEVTECKIQKQNVNLANKNICELSPNKLNEIEPANNVSTELYNSRNTRSVLSNECSTPSNTSSALPDENSTLSHTSSAFPNECSTLSNTYNILRNENSILNSTNASPNEYSTQSNSSSALLNDLLISSSVLPTSKQNLCESSVDVKDANSECVGIKMSITGEDASKYLATPNGDKSQQQKCNKLPSKSEISYLIENKELPSSSTIRCDDEASSS